MMIFSTYLLFSARKLTLQKNANVQRATTSQCTSAEFIVISSSTIFRFSFFIHVATVWIPRDSDDLLFPAANRVARYDHKKYMQKNAHRRRRKIN